MNKAKSTHKTGLFLGAESIFKKSKTGIMLPYCVAAA